jgi:hypothetical protein
MEQSFAGIDGRGEDSAGRLRLMAMKRWGALLMFLAIGCGSSNATTEPDAATDSATADIVSTVDTNDEEHGETAVDAGTEADAADAPDCAKLFGFRVRQPIRLPNQAAGLDLAGADGHGLKLDELTSQPCVAFDPSTGAVGWVPSIVELYVDPTSLRATQMTIFEDYIGQIQAYGPDEVDSYSIGLAPTRIAKNGIPFDLPKGWTSDPSFAQAADEIYRAIVHTFMPLVVLPPAGETCLGDKTCVVDFAAGGPGPTFFYIPVVKFAFWVDDASGAPPVPSIPTRFDLSFVQM